MFDIAKAMDGMQQEVTLGDVERVAVYDDHAEIQLKKESFYTLNLPKTTELVAGGEAYMYDFVYHVKAHNGIRFYIIEAVDKNERGAA